MNMLPKDALLAIFGFYGSDSKATSMMNLKNRYVESWHMLVHVCQKWQNVVFRSSFRSPHCLNLQLHCTPGTLVKRMLDVWPTLPIVMHHFGLTASRWGMRNIITALEHIVRVQFVRANSTFGVYFTSHNLTRWQPFFYKSEFVFRGACNLVQRRSRSVLTRHV